MKSATAEVLSLSRSLVSLITRPSGQVAILTTSIFLSACSPQTAPASEQERDLAGKAFVNCLHQAARRDDDHISPADSIALGILANCSRQNAAYMETFKRGLPLAAQRSFDDRMSRRADDLKVATSVVLDERKAD